MSGSTEGLQYTVVGKIEACSRYPVKLALAPRMTPSGNMVVLKTFPFSTRRRYWQPCDADAVRFIEFRVTSICRLRHRCLAQVVEVVDDYAGNSTTVVSEYASCGPIAVFSPDNTCEALEEVRVRRVIRQVADALAYLHRNGLTHGALKPNNVLLADADCDRVLVSDVGGSLWMLSAANSSDSSSSQDDPPPLTPTERCFLAPEQAAGSQSRHPRSDLWSLGVLAYTLLAGKLPPVPEPGNFCTSFPLPSTASDDALDFLSKTLKGAPQDRLTIPEMLLHPWLTKVHNPVEHMRAPSRESSWSRTLARRNALGRRNDCIDSLAARWQRTAMERSSILRKPRPPVNAALRAFCVLVRVCLFTVKLRHRCAVMKAYRDFISSSGGVPEIVISGVEKSLSMSVMSSLDSSRSSADLSSSTSLTIPSPPRCRRPTRTLSARTARVPSKPRMG